jgi:hypothetical protein
MTPQLPRPPPPGLTVTEQLPGIPAQEVTRLGRAWQWVQLAVSVGLGVALLAAMRTMCGPACPATIPTVAPNGMPTALVPTPTPG